MDQARSNVKREEGRARELYPEVVHLPDLVDAVIHQLQTNRITYVRRPNRAGRRTGRADLETGGSGRGRLTRSPAKAPATTKVTYTPLRRITRRYMPSQRPMVVGGGGMRGGRWRLGTLRRVEQFRFCERLRWESRRPQAISTVLSLKWAALLPSGPFCVFWLLSSLGNRAAHIHTILCACVYFLRLEI
jgi:hypothetical protein